MSEFTPGPWKAVRCEKHWNTGTPYYQIHYGSDGECVSELVSEEADAVLMAAAPELLEALIDWFSVMEDKAREETGTDFWIRRIEKARAAIAKAKGE